MFMWCDGLRSSSSKDVIYCICFATLWNKNRMWVLLMADIVILHASVDLFCFTRSRWRPSLTILTNANSSFSCTSYIFIWILNILSFRLHLANFYFFFCNLLHIVKNNFMDIYRIVHAFVRVWSSVVNVLVRNLLK